MLNKLLQMHVKLLQKEQFKKKQKTKATGDLIGNKIANKITKVSKNSQQHNLETNEEEILIGRYISPEERQNY